MIPRERSETLAMVWRIESPPPDTVIPRGYVLRTAVDPAAFSAVQRAIGFEVTPAAWSALATRLVGSAMVRAETAAGGEAVAVAAAEGRSDDWIELGWVAVAPAHRGRGLGLAVCSSLTQQFLREGRDRLFGSTQDHRLAALRIYFALGFVPLFRAQKIQRWRDVCRRLGVPFAPHTWGWPAEMR